MRIRNLGPDDFPTLLKYDWSPLIAERDTIYLFLARDHGQYCLVAEDDAGEPQGYLVGARSADGRSVFLFHVHVKSEFRSAGIGRQLVSRIEQIALADGVEIIWFLAREKARAFYVKMGYRDSSCVLPKEATEYVCRVKRASVMCRRLQGPAAQGVAGSIRENAEK